MITKVKAHCLWCGKLLWGENKYHQGCLATLKRMQGE